jgi:hypothetical protein
LGKILKIKRKSLFNFPSYSHPEIWEFQGVTFFFPFVSIFLSILKRESERDKTNSFEGNGLVRSSSVVGKFLVVQPNHEVRPYLPSTNFLCRTMAGGEVKTWSKSSRIGPTN